MRLVGKPTLATHRLLCGLSMREAAKQAGVSYGTIFRLEHGEGTFPSIARTLAVLYRVEVEDIFEVVGNPVSYQESCMRG